MFILSGSVSSCPVSAFATSTTHIKRLVSHSDTIVWAELLSRQIDVPYIEELEPNSSNVAGTLAELLALVKRDKIKSNHYLENINTSFNVLHSIHGNLFAMESKCEECTGRSSYLYHSMTAGDQYILFYQQGRIIGAVETRTIANYQRVLAIVENTNLSDHN